jgi:hypothetical protein
MLIPAAELDRIARGEIDTAFRRWKRPSVKAGGTLTTAVGVLAIEKVDVVVPANVSDADVKRAGFSDRAALAAVFDGSRPGKAYRIRLRLAGPDPRIALRAEAKMDAETVAAIAEKLARMDRDAAWTGRVLALIAEGEGRPARELAEAAGFETAAFKTRARRLKALGLTESLETGYRLSPRGEAYRKATACA